MVCQGVLYSSNFLCEILSSKFNFFLNKFTVLFLIYEVVVFSKFCKLNKRLTYYMIYIIIIRYPKRRGRPK